MVFHKEKWNAQYEIEFIFLRKKIVNDAIQIVNDTLHFSLSDKLKILKIYKSQFSYVLAKIGIWYVYSGRFSKLNYGNR